MRVCTEIRWRTHYSQQTTKKRSSRFVSCTSESTKCRRDLWQHTSARQPPPLSSVSFVPKQLTRDKSNVDGPGAFTSLCVSNWAGGPNRQSRPIHSCFWKRADGATFIPLSLSLSPLSSPGTRSPTLTWWYEGKELARWSNLTRDLIFFSTRSPLDFQLILKLFSTKIKNDGWKISTFAHYPPSLGKMHFINWAIELQQVSRCHFRYQNPLSSSRSSDRDLTVIEKCVGRSMHALLLCSQF